MGSEYRAGAWVFALRRRSGASQAPGKASGSGRPAHRRRAAYTVAIRAVQLAFNGIRGELATVPESLADTSPRKTRLRGAFPSGANRDRTGDLLLAKQALSQLSYGPEALECRARSGSASGRYDDLASAGMACAHCALGRSACRARFRGHPIHRVFPGGIWGVAAHITRATHSGASRQSRSSSSTVSYRARRSPGPRSRSPSLGRALMPGDRPPRALRHRGGLPRGPPGISLEGAADLVPDPRPRFRPRPRVGPRASRSTGRGHPAAPVGA